MARLLEQRERDRRRPDAVDADPPSVGAPDREAGQVVEVGGRDRDSAVPKRGGGVEHDPLVRGERDAARRDEVQRERQQRDAQQQQPRRPGDAYARGVRRRRGPQSHSAAMLLPRRASAGCITPA